MILRGRVLLLWKDGTRMGGYVVALRVWKDVCVEDDAADNAFEMLMLGNGSCDWDWAW